MHIPITSISLFISLFSHQHRKSEGAMVMIIQLFKVVWGTC